MLATVLVRRNSVTNGTNVHVYRMFLWSCVAYVATSQDTTAQVVAGKRLLLFEDKSGVATTVPCHTVP